MLEQVLQGGMVTAGVRCGTSVRVLWFLLLLCALVFGRSLYFGFVGFDDPDYVYMNPHVLAGWTWSTVRWAFSTYWAANWHPITWLSLAGISSLFGKSAGAYHAVNLALHAANAFLLYRLLVRMGVRAGSAALVAGLFAIHPAHVESVVWVSEHKDVLSTLLWLATSHGYLSWVKRKVRLVFLGMTVSFALALMAKPMVVSLPLTLLLLDIWPLGRLPLKGSSWKGIWARVYEKYPLFLLAGASCVATILAQRSFGAVANLQSLPLHFRLANAVLAGAKYVGMLLWPSGLAAYYPLLVDENTWPLVVGASVLLVSISLFCFRMRERCPFLPVGWAWFVITLLPVIGIVQVGGQALADRYTYIPSIGFFIMVVLGIEVLLDAWRCSLRWRYLGASLVLGVFGLVAHRQVGYWQNSLTLFQRAIRVTHGNWLAYERLGDTYLEMGRYQEAIQASAQATQIVPFRAVNQIRIGDAWMGLGHPDKALIAYQQARRINPRDLRPVFQVACILLQEKREVEALPLLEQVRLACPGQMGSDPVFVANSYRHTRMLLGILYRNKGDLERSSQAFLEILRQDRGDPSASVNLSMNLLSQGRGSEALPVMLSCAEQHPDNVGVQLILGRSAQAVGDNDKAIKAFQAVIKADPSNGEAKVYLGRVR